MNSPSHPRGLGWAVLLAMVYPSLLTWVYFDLLSTVPTGLQQTIFALGKTLQFSFPLWFLTVVERKRLTIESWRPSGLAVGGLFGLAVAAVIVAAVMTGPWPGLPLEALESAVRIKAQDLGIASPGAFIAAGVFYSVFHSFLEESFFRWFLFARLQRLLGLTPAIALSALGFAAHHAVVFSVYLGWSDPMTWLLTAGVAAGGVVWAWIYHRTGSITAVWLSHALVDAGIFAAGYQIITSG